MKEFMDVSRAATCASGVILESCSPESVVAKRRDSVQKPYGMTSVWGVRTATAGFTLIELLVVVLIIGILSAVALPQYTRAVEKSREAEVVSTFASLSRQMELCVLEFDEQNCDDCILDWDGLPAPPPCNGGVQEPCETKNWTYQCAGQGIVEAVRKNGASNSLGKLAASVNAAWAKAHGNSYHLEPNEIGCANGDDGNFCKNLGYTKKGTIGYFYRP